MPLADFINSLTPGQLAAIGQLGSSISALGRPYMDPTEPGRAFQQGLAGIPAAVQQADLAALQQRGLEGQVEAQDRQTRNTQALLEAITSGGGPAGGRTGQDPFIENQGLGGAPGPAGIVAGEGQVMGNSLEQLIAAAYPELFAKEYLGRVFAPPVAPDLAKDVEGFQRFTTGPRAGERAFPEAERDPTEGFTNPEKEAYRIYGSLEDPRAQDYVRRSRLGDGDGKPDQSDISRLAGEYRKDTASFKEARLGLEKVQNAANLQTGTGDTALIFGLMKVIDPRSTVREGEQATVEEAGGARRYLNLYNRVVRGERLTPQQRIDIVEAANSQFQPYVRTYLETERYYRERARRHGFDVRDVAPDVFGPLRQQYLPGVQQPAAPGTDAPVLNYNPVTRDFE